MDPLRVGVLGGWGRRIGDDGDDDVIIQWGSYCLSRMWRQIFHALIFLRGLDVRTRRREPEAQLERSFHHRFSFSFSMFK